ncbi:PQQ-binding-like beta-propeller repeat protein [Streptomyces asoensis]|uniref:outer membrane protein assembly factor BamB family protein n=1 Tax=Streptomyces asoensis TaxID=249586 RepID=UPI00332CF067
MPWTQRGVRALRDRRLHAVATVLLLTLTATTAAPPSRTSSASHNRHAASHRVTAVEQAPPVRWTATFPYSTHLDAFTRDSWFLQDYDTIRAVDVATGTTRWQEPSPVVDTVRRGATAADNHAVYPTQDAVVQARDSSTGSFRWERDLSNLRPTSADPDLFGVVSATVSRTSDVLYVVMWAGFTQRVTAALSTRTGTVLWHTESELLTEIGSTCLMSSDTQTQGVDCRTGVPQWKTDQTAEKAVIIDSAIVAVCDTEGRIRSLNAVTGRLLWETASPYPNPLTTLQAANGLIYFTDYNGRLYALDAATGTPRWSAPTDLTRKTPAIDRDHVYATGLDKHLYAFDATTGARVWAAPTGDYITADPQIVGNTVYAAGKDGRLHAINRTNGTHRWTTPASDAAITYLNATADHITTLTDPNTREQADPIAQQR